MLIDGYIIVVDYTEQKKRAAEINKSGVNINTVCRRINSTGRFYQYDIDELKEKMDAVWQLLKSSNPRNFEQGNRVHSESRKDRREAAGLVLRLCQRDRSAGI